jgi:hypothetical protein
MGMRDAPGRQRVGVCQPFMLRCSEFRVGEGDGAAVWLAEPAGRSQGGELVGHPQL